MKSIKGSFSGFGSSKKAGSSENIMPGIGKIAASVGIIASIWQGISPILKPVLKMFSILLTLLLLPLMPLIKQMVSGLAKTAGKVSEAQQEAGGGMPGLLAGFGELLKSPTIWALAGIGLAGSFVASLGALGIAGLLLTLISLDLVWDTITSGDESTLSEKLKGVGWAGMAAGIATLAFGAGVVPAISIGALVFSTGLGISLIADAMKEENLWIAIGEIAAGSLVLGVIAGGVISLITGGAIAGSSIILPIGGLIFAVALGWKLSGGGSGKMDSIEKTLGDQMTIPKEVQYNMDKIDFSNFTSGIDNANTKWITLNSTIQTGTQDLNMSVDELGMMFGSPSKGSFPLVYSIGLAQDKFSNFKNSTINMINTEIMPQVSAFGENFVLLLNNIGISWGLMKDESVKATNEVISNLDRIPREINTTHYIRTVYL